MIDSPDGLAHGRKDVYGFLTASLFDGDRLNVMLWLVLNYGECMLGAKKFNEMVKKKRGVQKWFTVDDFVYVACMLVLSLGKWRQKLANDKNSPYELEKDRLDIEDSFDDDKVIRHPLWVDDRGKEVRACLIAATKEGDGGFFIGPNGQGFYDKCKDTMRKEDNTDEKWEEFNKRFYAVIDARKGDGSKIKTKKRKAEDQEEQRRKRFLLLDLACDIEF